MVRVCCLDMGRLRGEWEWECSSESLFRGVRPVGVLSMAWARGDELRSWSCEVEGVGGQSKVGFRVGRGKTEERVGVCLGEDWNVNLGMDTMFFIRVRDDGRVSIGLGNGMFLSRVESPGEVIVDPLGEEMTMCSLMALCWMLWSLLSSKGVDGIVRVAGVGEHEPIS